MKKSYKVCKLGFVYLNGSQPEGHEVVLTSKVLINIVFSCYFMVFPIKLFFNEKERIK